MHARTSAVAALAVLAAAGLAAGCGAEGDKPVSLSEAKATLSRDCQRGNTPKTLCDCIADRLAKAGNDAEEILAINKTVNGGTTTAAVTKAIQACMKVAAP